VAQVEGARDAAARKATDRADTRANLRAQLDDVHAIQHAHRTGYLATKAFLHYLRTGKTSLEIDNLGQKAALVLNATGQTLVPVDIALDILNVARTGVFRSLADARPTNRTKHRAGLLTAASVGWGRLETGGSLVDANTVPEGAGTPQEVEVFDLLALAQIGVDELDDSPEAAEAAVVDAISSEILEAEDTAFAVGAAADRPKGIVNATNIARIPAGNKVAVSVSNTPTWAQLTSIPGLLADRFRDNATWVMHPTSATKIAALTEATGFEPGPNGRGLLGWPVRLLSSLPDPATAGTGDASILFGDFRAAYRIADRDRGQISVQRLVQRYIELGLIGLLVKVRVGGDLVRPSAVALYTQ
jgi:HK97 family phage major capsid protein